MNKFLHFPQQLARSAIKLSRITKFFIETAQLRVSLDQTLYGPVSDSSLTGGAGSTTIFPANREPQESINQTADVNPLFFQLS